MSAVRHVGRTSIVAAALAVSLLLILLPNRAGAQADIDRFNRQLELIQRQTILQIDQNLSLSQRAYFDYGGYAVIGYLSADDNVNDNHVLRQYQAYGYARFNPDGGANEFFLRGVWTWQNFNHDDAFNNHDDNN